jgi:tetratricopeptide (TPR) repeat protein
MVPAIAAGIVPAASPARGPLAARRQRLYELHRRIAFELYEQRDLGWAAQHFAEAVRFDSEDAALHATLGGIYAAKRQLGPAERELRAAAQLEPGNTEHQERLGIVLERQNKPREAAAVYKNVIWVNNKDAAAHQHLGFTLERQGKTTEAIRSYQTALKLDPQNLTARCRLNRLLPPPCAVQAAKRRGTRIARRP